MFGHVVGNELSAAVSHMQARNPSLNSPRNGGNGPAGSYGMSSGLVQGTGSPASTNGACSRCHRGSPPSASGHDGTVERRPRSHEHVTDRVVGGHQRLLVAGRCVSGRYLVEQGNVVRAVPRLIELELLIQCVLLDVRQDEYAAMAATVRPPRWPGAGCR